MGKKRLFIFYFSRRIDFFYSFFSGDFFISHMNGFSFSAFFILLLFALNIRSNTTAITKQTDKVEWDRKKFGNVVDINFLTFKCSNGWEWERWIWTLQAKLYNEECNRLDKSKFRWHQTYATEYGWRYQLALVNVCISLSVFIPWFRSEEKSSVQSGWDVEGESQEDNRRERERGEERERERERKKVEERKKPKSK